MRVNISGMMRTRIMNMRERNNSILIVKDKLFGQIHALMPKPLSILCSESTDEWHCIYGDSSELSAPLSW